MNRNLFYLFLLVLAGCAQGELESPKVFFAGEIVNPTSDYVILLKDDKKLDSVKLDANNRFSFELDSVTDGLHNFSHAPEFQYIYLEQGDSIQIRLNTMDFDESLVFTGDNEEINNFLISIFLSNEVEEKKIRSSYFKLEPESFEEKIEALRLEKLNTLTQLTNEGKISAEAVHLAEVSINSTYYNYKEVYPFEHRKRTGNKLKAKLTDNFYGYRKDLNFNKENLTYLKPYYNFVKSHFKNISYFGCEKQCGIEDEKIINQLHFNRHKLSLIDSLVEEKKLKDNLFRNVAMEYLLKGADTEKNNEIFINDFLLRSQNNKHIDEINELYEGIRNMQPQKEIPNLFVTDMEGNNVSLKDIAKNKKVAFYFWSGENRGGNKRYFKDVVKRANKLADKNKDYVFIGINYKTDAATWKGMIENSNLDKQYQFKAEDFDELAKTLIFHQRNKCIITNDAKIVDGFTTMWAANF